MYQCIGYHFSRDDISKALPLVFFQKETIRQMFPAKFHELFITFDQVGFDNFPVIIPIYIYLAKQCIRHIGRYHICNYIIFSQKHDRSQIVSFCSGDTVYTIQSCTF